MVSALRNLLERHVYGWSGGLGSNIFVDPDGTAGVLLTQVEMGERMQILLDELQALPEAA